MNDRWNHLLIHDLFIFLISVCHHPNLFSRPDRRWARCLPFRRMLLRWVLMSISQSLRRELCVEEEAEWGEGGRWGEGACCRGSGRREALLHRTSPAGIHFFATFWADLVTLPPLAAFLSTALMTPTATVCLMSRTAKRPGGDGITGTLHVCYRCVTGMLQVMSFLRAIWPLVHVWFFRLDGRLCKAVPSKENMLWISCPLGPGLRSNDVPLPSMDMDLNTENNTVIVVHYCYVGGP